MTENVDYAERNAHLVERLPEIIQRRSTGLKRYATNFGLTTHCAEDVLQETFVDVMERLEEKEFNEGDGNRLEAYVILTYKRRCSDLRKSLGHRVRMKSRDLKLDDEENYPCPRTPEPIRDIMLEEYMALLEGILQRMPEEHQRVFNNYNEGKPLDNHPEDKEISQRTLQNRLGIVRKRLTDVILPLLQN